MNRTKVERGDTIIEVLLAVSIFSMVAVSSMAIMNMGLSTAQRSLEITQVRHQIDGQAELLRYVHSQTKLDNPDQEYVELWNDINKDGEVESIIGTDRCPENFPAKGFALVPVTEGDQLKIKLAGQASGDLGYSQPETFARVDSSGSQGIFIQLAEVENGRAYDAYIQACWDSLGVDRPMTIGTIVRIYDPDV